MSSGGHLNRFSGGHQSPSLAAAPAGEHPIVTSCSAWPLWSDQAATVLFLALRLGAAPIQGKQASTIQRNGLKIGWRLDSWGEGCLGMRTPSSGLTYSGLSGMRKVAVMR